MNGAVRVIVQYRTKDGERLLEAERVLSAECFVNEQFPRHLVGAAARQAFDDVTRSTEYGA